MFPHAPTSTIYRNWENWRAYGSVRRPKEACLKPGPKNLITPVMSDWLIDRIAQTNDMWQAEMMFDLFVEFDVSVCQKTMSRFLQDESLSKKVATRVAAQQDWLTRCCYELEVKDIAAEDLVYVDESYASEKVMFRRSSWSAIGLPAFTHSILRHATRLSVLPALSINGFMLDATLIVQGSVTKAIFEHWLEHLLLPQLSPGKVLVMDNCSTHHSEKVRELCLAAGIRLLYLPPYSPDYNPIELTFHLLKQWLRKHRDLAPQWGSENYDIRFTQFLRSGIEHCLDGKDITALFRKCKVTC